MRVASASVLICTYNRARLLRETLRAVEQMTLPSGCDVEIVVVDNNSTDNTPAVIADAVRRSRLSVVALREPAQGKSFALNRALATARGDVLALTDDDVWPDSEWLLRIVQRFRERHVTFVFGKVLPRWGALPPPELLTPAAQVIWGPLALLDYGDQPIEYRPPATGLRLPIGANLAILREAALRVGGWRTDLGKIDNTLTSGEDHEIFCRLRRAGLFSGLYDPEIVVRHYVPSSRLTRDYFRRWFYWSGRTYALMLQDIYPEVDMTKVPRIGGVPRFILRQALHRCRLWLQSRWPGTPALKALNDELRVLQFAGLIAQCWKLRASTLRSHEV